MEAVDRVPLIFGVGGSGTRIPAEILDRAGFHLGHTNQTHDWWPGIRFAQAFGAQYAASNEDEDLIWRTEDLRNQISHHVNVYAKPVAIKENQILHYLDSLLSWFPNTFQLVHVIRDGRDMAHSSNDTAWIRYRKVYLGERELAEPKPVQRAKLWVRANLYARDAAERHRTPYYKMRYEDLVEFPNEETESLLSVVGSDAEVEVEIEDPGTIGRWREQEHAERVNRIVRRGRV